jgi:hypothetical protein
VKLLLMLFLKVDIIHLPAFGAFLDVPPAVPKVSGDFGFGEGFETVVADLGGLLGHGYKQVSNIFL